MKLTELFKASGFIPLYFCIPVTSSFDQSSVFVMHTVRKQVFLCNEILNLLSIVNGREEKSNVKKYYNIIYK